MSITVSNLLNDSSNYLEEYKQDDITIINKFNTLLKEYLIQLQESLQNINIIDSKKIYIIIVGLSTITNVFRLVLIYTKNLDISYQISKKSIYYYLEFIGQICEDQLEFLKLTPKDASIFVYKKTIDIIKKPNNNKFNSNNTLENILRSNYNIISKVIISILNNNKKITNTIFNKIKYIISTYNSEILQLKKNNNIDNFQNKLAVIELCTDALNIDNTNHINNITISFIIGVLKRLIKNNININKVQIGLIEIKNKQKLNNERKLINFFFAICSE